MTAHDNYLKNVIEYLAEHWMDVRVGLVASGIFDPEHPPVIGTSEQVEEGRWLHAERNVLRQFERKYGEPSPETIVVVTLSPCIRPMSKSRIGASCTEFLVKHGLTHVHAGVIDQTHVSNGIREYRNHGIELTLTKDTRCKKICENLLGIFQTYGERVNDDLTSVKEEIGYRIFSSDTHI